jgi:hypothetical protein
MVNPKDVHPWKKSIVTALPFTLAMLLVLSCSIIAPAATATPAKPTDTNTPEATNTPLPTDTSKPTATKKATPNKAATEKAKEGQTKTANAEMAGAILGEIESKLDEVGEIMGYGSVILFDPNPIAIESSKHNVIWYWELNNYYKEDIRAADFAFHTNIKWETKQKVGLVNCFILFRIEGDINMDGWYAMRMGRISGAPHIWFEAYQGWSFIAQSQGHFSQYIRDEGGAENEVILVARGTEFTAYANGHQVDVWWNSRVDSGAFGLGTWQDTGSSVCTFSDNWIWSWD